MILKTSFHCEAAIANNGEEAVRLFKSRNCPEERRESVAHSVESEEI